jgi:hypothetical protein
MYVRFSQPGLLPSSYVEGSDHLSQWQHCALFHQSKLRLRIGVVLHPVLSQSLAAMMSLPTTLALSTSIQLVPSICLEKSMRDGLSAILSQWAELDKKFSEFCELLTFEGNNMNVTIYKKQFCDLQLEWKELNKKSNFILEYKQCHKGMLKRTYPLICFQIVFALIVHLGYCKAKMEWQVRIHLASLQYVMVFMVTVILVLLLIFQLKTMKSMSFYTTHITVGGISLNILFFSRNQTRRHAGQCQDSNKIGNIWGQGNFCNS